MIPGVVFDFKAAFPGRLENLSALFNVLANGENRGLAAVAVDDFQNLLQIFRLIAVVDGDGHYLLVGLQAVAHRQKALHHVRRALRFRQLSGIFRGRRSHHSVRAVSTGLPGRLRCRRGLLHGGEPPPSPLRRAASRFFRLGLCWARPFPEWPRVPGWRPGPAPGATGSGWLACFLCTTTPHASHSSTISAASTPQGSITKERSRRRRR